MAASLRLMKAQLRARSGYRRHEPPLHDVYYPASNRLAADVALNAGRRGWRGLDKATVAVIEKQSCRQNMRPRPISGALPARSSLRQYEALARRKLAHAYPQLDKAYRGSPQARRRHTDVGICIRYRVSRASELCRSRRRQREIGGEGAAREIARVRSSGRGFDAC